MHYYVLTLFPEMITNACGESILGRASQKGLISVEAINIRDYSTNKHNRVDDYPYGGGAGMVMQPMPVYDAWKDLTERIGKKPRVLFMTPQGKPFSQKLAEEYAKEEDLIFLCGHYDTSFFSRESTSRPSTSVRTSNQSERKKRSSFLTSAFA